MLALLFFISLKRLTRKISLITIKIECNLTLLINQMYYFIWGNSFVYEKIYEENNM